MIYIFKPAFCWMCIKNACKNCRKATKFYKYERKGHVSCLIFVKYDMIWISIFSQTKEEYYEEL